MEALKEIIEIFKEFDGNNVWIVIGISAVLLFIAAGYIQLLNASKIEAILMDQKGKKSIFYHYDFYSNIDFCGCKQGKYQYNKLGGFRDIGRSA